MRFFNTAGPIQPQHHYHIPPLERLDLDGVRTLIRQQKYFVLHAPRQTGKTSVLLALRDLLNAEDSYHCVYVNVEGAQALREDVEQVMRTLLAGLASRARLTLGDEFLGNAWSGILAEVGPGAGLQEALTRWAEASPKPLVLLIDEIDALIGDALLSVLRQLRAGYDLRPEGFPQSVVLCGVRDVRDYRIQSTAENAIIAGGSAFNIKARSLRLGDFSRVGGARVTGAAYRGDGPTVYRRCLRNGLDVIPKGSRGWSTHWPTKPVLRANLPRRGIVRSRPTPSIRRGSSSSYVVRRIWISWPTSCKRSGCGGWSSRC